MSGTVSKNGGRASGIVGARAIGADAVDSANIADDAIDSEHYTDASIDNAHLADNAVGLAEMAGGTDGNIISYDASGDPVAIATGNDGQVLTSTGAGSPPAFEDAAGGGFIKLGGATFSGSTTVVINHSDFDMDQAVSTGYDGYKLYLNINSNGGTNHIQMRASDDNGSSYLSTATYNYQTDGRYGGGDNHQHSYGEDEWGIMQPRVINAVTDQSMDVEMTMIKSRYTASVCFSALVQWMWQDGASAGDTATGTQALQQHSSTVDALQLISTVSTIDGCWSLYGMKA